MVGFVAGLLTSAVVKIASDKLSSAVAEEAGLLWNFTRDLNDMKDMMESMAAVLKDAEKQSVKKESVGLWLKRLKDAALDISDMMDDYQDTETQPTAKMPGVFSCLTAARKKMVLASKMKNMRERLEKINKERQDFTFKESTTASQDQQRYDERETASAVNEAEILGRDGEKNEIIDILSTSQSKDGTMVLPIYGLGGMGKSTLAQLVYNDTQFKQYDHRVWVYVSQEFDLKKIGKNIISRLSTDGGQQNLDTLDIIYQRLDELLPGKSILIVLDDIWQEDALELDKLKRMLHVDKKGSMVDAIVTTRSESIAKIFCANEPHKLQPLKDDVCWDIIKRYSGFEDKSNKGELERIGLDIAKKCGGVPLAAQALGYTLRSKDLHGWSEMNNSDIWNESSGVDDSQHMKVLPSLKLSYERMLPILRLCFSYCAIFPKGHDIHEDDLVHQWVALDFIKKPSEGKEYIKQLMGMSFLEHSKLPLDSVRSRTPRYTMHDLVHDLARSVIGDELIVIDAAKKSHNTSQQKYCRYAVLTNYDGQTKLLNILPKKVRALHFSSSSKLGPHDGSFSFAKCLRILDFSECSGIILPSSIDQLNRLKCLIAPQVQNERLLESIGELSKLQYLNLYGSFQMSALPESLSGLQNLVHLDISYCYGITVLPESLGELKNLVHLVMSFSYRITVLPESLGELNSLVYLNISSYFRITALPESLGGLKSLMRLDMSCCKRITVLPESLGELNSLVHLGMSHCYRITALPESLGGLKSLMHLDMSYCSKITVLPESLGELKSLVHLDMSKCSRIIVLPESLGHLTNLRYLNLHSCSGVKEIPESLGALSQLQHLNLSHCANITSLPEAIGSLINLQYLNLSYCENLESLPDRISKITTPKSLLTKGCSDELKDQASSKLHYSVILPYFKVRVDDISACSNLTLLEDVNDPELRIHSLENVRFLEETHKVKLLDKSDLSELTLAWTLHADRFLDDMDLLGQLVPPRGLKRLNVKGYSSPSFPSWLMGISCHLPNLFRITLDSLSTCSNLPPLGQLPKLEMLSVKNCHSVTKIDKSFCGGKGAFPRLSEFKLRDMEGLEEWSTTYSIEDGDAEEFMFPKLNRLHVSACPRLRLKPCPPIFSFCIIDNSDQVISSLEEVGNNIGHLASSIPSTGLSIHGSHSKSLRLFHHFPALQHLKIHSCLNLTSLPESMRHLASLWSLELICCQGISALPEWIGDLSSLGILTIERCKSIYSLPPSVEQLTKLKTLFVSGNPELKRWCESEENKNKLAHINEIIYGDCD